VLFARGFSREHGPIIGENIEWLIDDEIVVQYGGTLDIRKLDTGIDLRSDTKLALGIHRVSLGFMILWESRKSNWWALTILEQVYQAQFHYKV
jgi:hypothetical protein